MQVRILTAWAGSPDCGAVVDLPEALAQVQIGRGLAEAVAGPDRQEREPETAMLAPAEQAVAVKRGRKR